MLTVLALCGRVKFTENANFGKWLVMWSQSEDIKREHIVLFSIGFSLQWSLIVNWQLNVYAHKFK